MAESRRHDADLTAIIIAHDVRDEVLRCVGSLVRERGDLRLQIILVDNGSADGTAHAVSATHPEVQVVALPRNIGIPARNHGLARAHGRHRMFIDSDAMVTPGALETIVGILDTHPGVGLVGPRLIYPDGRLQLSARRFPPFALPLLRRPPLDRWFEDGPLVRHHLMADEPHDRRRRVEYVLGACQVFTAQAQEAAGRIDDKIWFGPDDADWCFKIRRAGFDILYVPDAEVIHDYRRSTAARPWSRRSVAHLRAFARFQWRWRRERQALLEEGRAFDAEAAGHGAA